MPTTLTTSLSSDRMEPNLSRMAEWRAKLDSIRQQARGSYQSGASGLQVASLISQSMDDFILEIYREALQHRTAAQRTTIEEQGAVIAIGGSGRGEMAPYSDVDLLFLHRPSCRRVFEPFAGDVIRNLGDAWISLGHSTRTIGNALEMAADPQFLTALLEARLLAGNQRLFVSLQSKLRRYVHRRQSSVFAKCVKSREEERAKFGATVRQLEPEIKRSPGGLRDVHLIRWTGYVRFGTSDIDLLRRQDALTQQDAQTLQAAVEFLTRIRIDLHFSAGTASEVLSWPEQLRLAQSLGYRDNESQRDVEQFMQTYFRHSTAIADISARFVARHEPHTRVKRLWKSLFRRRSNGIFLVTNHELDVLPRHRESVCQRLEDVLKVYELAAKHSVSLSPLLVETIKRVVPELPDDLSPESIKIFLTILSGSGRVGPVLRDMYSTGVLEKVLPAFAHTRCLIQFNQYHSYTVDEHTLRVIEAADAFATKPGALGDAYGEIRHKEILHLAMLLHDAGKGFSGDHSDVGRRIAGDMADRLRLSAHQRDLLMFLVHKHLNMSHVALLHNIDDDVEVLNFARNVGSPEYLRMLFVLTAADIQGVGPNAWTDWKGLFLTQLYERAMLALSGEDPHTHDAERLTRLRAEVLPILNSAGNGEPWTDESLARYFDTFARHYLLSTPATQIAADLRHIQKLNAEQVIVEGKYDATSKTVEYRVLTLDTIGSGCFSKMAGTLAAKRMQILSATISTSTGGIVIDSFRVVDTDHAQTIPEFRLDEVKSAIRDVLLGRDNVESLFRRSSRFTVPVPVLTGQREATRVAIDNDSSVQFTIIDVFANDRPGLLYTITACLRDLGLSVSLAKIGTNRDQVLDVFYVTDRGGAKLLAESRLDSIQRTLVERIEEFERKGFAA
jgi:[protein-PII] uridylyltransferase